MERETREPDVTTVDLVDVVDEAAAFRTAFRDWLKDYAVRRRSALQTGQAAHSAETDFRRWSSRYFDQRVDPPKAHEAPRPALLTVLKSFWIRPSSLACS